jgi:hypothetical protein
LTRRAHALRTGSCERDHPCREDTYHLTFTVHSLDEFEEHWEVQGPDKNYRAITTLRREPPDPPARWQGTKGASPLLSRSMSSQRDESRFEFRVGHEGAKRGGGACTTTRRRSASASRCSRTGVMVPSGGPCGASSALGM